ncbi:MAG TPA: alanine--tRNA ligase [Pyrinomonadaceae bacterium]|nr:alanine--tRNA ligase [Pyrinomonadaceae bacterium]
MMTGNEIREKFLEYFERHGHTRVRSSPLLPANDPTLLFTNAGMNQFKDVFLGNEKRDYVRACSSQKCLRAGGKHNDLDEVGKTARHQTFFEMLGNFSFGDYFKEDAIKFAWDLLVNEFKLDPARMWFTVFEGDAEVGPDEEAEKFWQQVGAPKERVLRFGRKDNFWQMGETGPCGPCSEIHYYMGNDPSDAANCAANVNGPGDTITEIWNLVFMQFDRQRIAKMGAGKVTITDEYTLQPLPAPSVDTGMGLERLCVVLQGVKSNYETDLFQPIIQFVSYLCGIPYSATSDQGFAMRVIADHARATAFSVADGIVPGNEGRNYVLRKIMRRAIYHGRNGLSLTDPFFHEVTNYVCELMRDAYPELEASREVIERVVRLEEQRFNTTLETGLQKLNSFFSKFEPQRRKIIERWERQGSSEDDLKRIITLEERKQSSEAELFKELAKLYDTFGTPPDLARVSVERNLNRNYLIKRWAQNLQPDFLFVGPNGDLIVIESKFYEHFDAALQELQQGSTIGKTEQKTKSKPIYAKIANRVQSLFRGYETTRVDDAKVLALICGDEEVQELNEGEDGGVVLDQTPFYAESGGQVGDMGHLFASANNEQSGPLIATVTDTYSPVQGLIIHKVRIEKGSIKVGDTVTAEVDVEKRDATRRNHTATHLVHAALREVLGAHVKQAGSVVAPNYLRFDFNHYQPLTEVEVKEVERLVNEQILRNVKVDTEVMPVEDAIRAGAMALFGEKYAGLMRVLTVPGFSKELCGGTHVRATGDIGVFKITSDESIASGVRRIYAITGFDAYERFREDEKLIEEATANLRTSRAELPKVIGRLQDELKKARREAEELKLKIASGAIGSAASNGDEAREVAGVKVLAREASGLDAAGMRQLSDTLLARIKSGVVVLGRTNDGKASLIVRTSDDLTKKVPAGQVIKELAPIIGGRGGGKADMAEGGGSQPEKLAEALQASYGVIERMLK